MPESSVVAARQNVSGAEPERIGCLEVNDDLERRLLDRRQDRGFIDAGDRPNRRADLLGPISEDRQIVTVDANDRVVLASRQDLVDSLLLVRHDRRAKTG